MQIRPIEERDIPALEQICLETASKSLKKDETAKACTLFLYNRYYTRCERENCFAVTDSNDIPVGYILCAPNYGAYQKSFRKTECKAIREYGILRFLYAYFEPAVQKKYRKKYPAHLHIDILPAYQSKGAGTALMDTLKAHLRTRGVSGVFLCVGKQNSGALRFYKRNGFQVLDVRGGAVLMGCKL